MSSSRFYGAIPDEKGTQFRVWAPSIGTDVVDFVNLLLYENGSRAKVISMNNGSHDGTWECYVKNVGPGQRYNFEINGRNEKLDPWAREVTSSAGQSVVVGENDYQWQCNDFVMPPKNELVIYQMHVRTYPDNDKGLQNQLSSVTEDLWYLHKLGINAIQLLPTSEFEGDNSWGYNPSCIFAIESSYGGPAALKRLVDNAHFFGIAVFLDVVYNHLSPDSSKGLYQFTPWHLDVKTNGSQYETGGIYFYNDERSYTPFGNRPDYGRPEVRDFIQKNALMWLKEYRIDGLRYDSVGNIRNIYDDPNGKPDKEIPDGERLIRSMNIAIHQEAGNSLIIAEDLKNDPWVTQAPGDEFNGGLGFDTQWEEIFFDEIRKALITDNDENRDMFLVEKALRANFNNDVFQRIIFLENHDKVADKQGRPGRLADCIQPQHVDDGLFARKRSTLGAALLMTAPGIPMIHQGQEILEWRRFGDQAKENGVDWDRFCSKILCNSCLKKNGCDSDKDPNGLCVGVYNLYRDLIKLRRNWFNNTRGLRGQNINVYPPNNKDKVIAFHRWENGGAGDDVVVIANFANRSYDSYTIGFPRAGQWKVRFNSDESRYSSMFSNFISTDTTASTGNCDGMPFQGNIAIGPYTVVILSQDN